MRRVAPRALALIALPALLLPAACSEDAPENPTGVSESTVSDGASESAATVDCPPEGGAQEQVQSFDAAPPMCIDTAKTYTAVMTTDAGEITIELDDDKAPETVNNFVVLSRYKFYDGVTFHRVIPTFMIQGGDPSGDGSGGPGYTFGDELPDAGEYEVGSVAMANAGPDTNGSQFFIVTGDAGVALPAKYTLFGTVTDGMDVVKTIEGDGSESGAPQTTHTIESVTIEEE
ncbi:hypothetical protein GCM10022199_08050 [Marihabitans asiaticum]|uniref:Peptidyl-prolyl cis-trans isomerase n=1 Tax=Marihabitans asiaticum TaxID=415218 RepID=A0A560WGZ8_9MICO|nr:peptidylprolyl isomerase [Marihabitans asiaticum]TWD16836.1 peptidylprolyl isomerase [Marihabitans asiaticum]